MEKAKSQLKTIQINFNKEKYVSHHRLKSEFQ